MSTWQIGLQITLVGVLVVFTTFAILVFLMQWARSALSGTGFVLRRKLAMPGPVPPNLAVEAAGGPAAPAVAGEMVPAASSVPVIIQFGAAGPGAGAVPAAMAGGSARGSNGEGTGDEGDDDDDGISLEKAAAVSAVVCEVMLGAPYEIVSVRRVEDGGAASGSVWSLAGRMDVMRSREMLSRRKG